MLDDFALSGVPFLRTATFLSGAICFKKKLLFRLAFLFAKHYQTSFLILIVSCCKAIATQSTKPLLLNQQSHYYSINKAIITQSTKPLLYYSTSNATIFSFAVAEFFDKRQFSRSSFLLNRFEQMLNARRFQTFAVRRLCK